MQEHEIRSIIEEQRKCFQSGATLDVEIRVAALQKLKHCINKYEPEINTALKKDLGKSGMESYMCEVGMVLSELSYMIKHTRKFAKEQTVKTPLRFF